MRWPGWCFGFVNIVMVENVSSVRCTETCVRGDCRAAPPAASSEACAGKVTREAVTFPSTLFWGKTRCCGRRVQVLGAVLLDVLLHRCPAAGQGQGAQRGEPWSGSQLQESLASRVMLQWAGRCCLRKRGASWC